jgi:manganese transport protein
MDEINTLIYPFILKRREASINIHEGIELAELQNTISKPFNTIALAFDYSDKDEKVIQYALQLGNADTRYILIHIVESAQARLLEDEAKDYETIKDKEQLRKYEQFFTDKGFSVAGILGFNNRTKEIARITKEHNCDLLVVGSHGHKNIKDWIFGETINVLRHKVDIPVFIAR